MAQSLTLKIRGLYTSDNDLGSVPEGALLKAKNIVIDRADIAEPRRGFDKLSANFGSADDRAQRLWVYKDTIFAHVDSATDYISYWDGAAWQSVGNYSAPTDGKVYSAESNQNLYFSTSSGVKKLTGYAAAAVQAGAYKGLDVQASLQTTTPLWLDGQNYVAYRVVWGYKDANNNLILGAPSQREVIQNTLAVSTFRSISLSVAIPDGVTTAWFVQVYRSAQGIGADPSDEMQLVYEGNPSAGDIIAKTMTVSDITPDSLKGATLYASASQEGIANANEQPPLCKDLVVFKGHTFFANITSKHRYYLTLIAVNSGGSPTTGMTSGDTVTLGGVVYTGGGAENVGTRTFKVFTAGSASQNIRDTAISLIRVINRAATSTVYAYYLSGANDLPGKMLLEERSIGGASFAVISSRATCWSPDLPTSGTTEISSNDEYKNGLAFSKNGQPEAVPLKNLFQVGSKDEKILRIVPLRDSLFIFKEDGIFRCTGDDASNFAVTLLDSSAKILAAESLAVLNNQIFGLADQGVVTVSETGVSVISRQIEEDLLALFGASLDNVKAYSWGVSYESERKYILWTISGAADTYATQAYVYNTFTNSWVRWELSKRCGIVNPADDKLYLGDAAGPSVNQERKTRTFTDQVDYGFATNILNVNAAGTVITLTSADLMSVGDLLYQSSSVFSFISAVDVVAGTVTVSVSGAFTAGVASLYQAIDTEIQWVPHTLGNPAGMKHDHTVIFLFKSDFSGIGYATFKSDLSPAEETVEFAGAGIGNWGLFTWGSIPWGGTNQKRPVRTYVPLNKQVNSQLTVGFRHAWAYASWQLTGISVVGETGTEAVSR